MISKIKELHRSIRNKKKEKELVEYCEKYDIAPKPSIPLHEIKSIALLRWDNKLGDSIMSTLFISNMQRHRPDIKITVITQSFCAEWFKKSTSVEVVECGKRGLETANSFKKHKGKFDAVVELGSSFDFKELVALYELGAMYNIGYKKNKYNIFNTSIRETAVHFSERYLEVARIFTDQEFSTDFPIIPFPKNKVFNRSLGNRYVAVNLFGSSKYRQYNKKEAVKLLKKWIEIFPNDYIYLIPVPDKVDLLKDIESTIGSDKILMSSTEPSLEHTLQLLEQTDFCFTPDTSVVHLAGALNTPIIAIFSSNTVNFQEWKPLSERSEVIFNTARKTSNSRNYVYDFSWDELERKLKKIIQ